ncbi:pantetheine-phosphate adenylyltransferase [Streptococcus moroccensis]|uniref:Phosphopantetheine adenylyltransferase n=1 Tax=Streptococcus moroccensis TaxID=1451356 RepID=A0ABT9YND9_9STRE|nr:pantetheine-phosphate adenylyltransferase [Streptococcus moroccensis]MDQ0221506.1 pantetheine-phosphate adenylyltransferase [Streptococcus moroccensis]
MSKKIGLFTGSFDPMTLGHLDLIERASQLFDELLVGIFYNPHKQGLLTLEQRLAVLEKALSHLDNVRVLTAENQLVVEVARREGVTHLVRGLRNASDLEYEASFDFYNRNLAPELETVYLLAKPEYKYVSSSGVRELITFKADFSAYVPDSIAVELEKYLETKQ